MARVLFHLKSKAEINNWSEGSEVISVVFNFLPVNYFLSTVNYCHKDFSLRCGRIPGSICVKTVNIKIPVFVVFMGEQVSFKIRISKTLILVTVLSFFEQGRLKKAYVV